MNNNVTAQLFSLLIFIISGIIIGLLFDVFRILRKSFKTIDLVTYIEDIVFWILTGIFILSIIFIFENGQIRSYSIIGTILGISLYLFTISKYFIKVNVKILNIIKNIFSVILNTILYVIKLLLKPFTGIIIKLKNILTKNKIKKQKNI